MANDPHTAVEWRAIPGIAGYAVSSTGQVKRTVPTRGSRTGHVLTPHLASRAKCYETVSLRMNGALRRFRVHRLVALAFIGQPPTPAHEIAHIDGNPSNNAAENLRWATAAENAADRERHGTVVRGEASVCAKLTADDVRAIRAATGRYADIAAPYGIDRHTVGDIKLRKTWAWLP